ncbi:MAG: DUF4071 domain-containing protein [Rhodobacteraceae bacterium]|nr:DUF4071 domain-containing protein [Paracoccaceae bacterium]
MVKKADHESGRVLDLDATYEAIIQPSVEANGYRCIRAIDILHSGVIDRKMYEMLLRADLVIADISTGNVNAVYELGVRHALRPFSTIVMKEKEGKMHFDLDHTAIFMYEHLGTDIGNREAKRAKEKLSRLIQQISEKSEPDSPVYTYIPFLKEPNYTEEEFEESLDDAEEDQDNFSSLLDSAEQAATDSNHLIAAKNFKLLLEQAPNNPYLRQQAALHTYKSKDPSEPLALIEATNLLKPLEPEKSNDTETLGLSGAIYKRLWNHNKDRKTLDLAIKYYKKGFDLNGDYYTGENAALCLEKRSKLHDEAAEKLYDKMTALKIRETIVNNLETTVISENFDERTDQIWIFATLSHCLFALNRKSEANKYEKKFYDLESAEWVKKTYLEAKKMLKK